MNHRIISMYMIWTIAQQAHVFGVVSCDISRINNKTAHEAVCALRKKTDGPLSLRKIKPFANTRISAKLPFVSTTQFKKAFLDHTPYTPEEAIRIMCNGIEYLLWVDERGIVCAQRAFGDDFTVPRVIGKLPPAVKLCSVMATLVENPDRLLVEIVP